ncbi:MAG: pyridine nucleotide-disulfide oxidoreductase [Anaerolineales bacterium]|nr:FAD-dependent oxidoreductase [Anaerolineae bacterium]PWB74405.1 MAG: pyridine nucleotide-disulfide oxidoreductase [Anaerolineales bacterium]
MVEPKITVYGAYWCPDCRRAKKFLGEQFVPYKWVDIEQDKEAEEFVLKKNDGKRIIPTIVFEDGSFLVEPTNAELAQKLGLTTEAKKTYYDLIIVGGGPAGLTAAIYAAREGADTLLIERSGLGGQAGITVGLDNFPGFPEGISGQEFSDRVAQQARRFGVEILQAVDVERLEMEAGYHEVYTSDGRHYHSRAVLIATGASYRRLEVPGEEDFIGAGIHFCATCDGPFYKGSKEIVVVGGGNSAVEEGLHLTNFTEKVTLLVRGDKLTASQIAIDKVNQPNSGVEVKYNTVVEAFEGQGSKLKTIKYHHKDSDETEEIHPAAAFIFIGQTPNTAFLKEYAELDKYGFVLTGHDLSHGDKHDHRALPFESSVPGIFAAGDARHGSTKQVASAVGEGAAASISIREFLKKG